MSCRMTGGGGWWLCRRHAGGGVSGCTKFSVKHNSRCTLLLRTGYLLYVHQCPALDCTRKAALEFIAEYIAPLWSILPDLKYCATKTIWAILPLNNVLYIGTFEGYTCVLYVWQWGRAKGIVWSDFISVANQEEWKWCTGEGTAKAMVAISSRWRRLNHSNCKEHHPIILMLKHSRILLPSLTH